MSFDLYFYKRKRLTISETEIGDFLTNNLTPSNKGGNQWYFENEDTEVYFSFDHNEPEDDPEEIELFENFPDFDNTHFTFNINFLRPIFFGIEAFSFVDKFITELDLFVLNPQSNVDAENPLKYCEGELFNNWAAINLGQSAEHFKEFDLNYYPLDKSNNFWDFNFKRKAFQEQLGNNYFVPGVFYLKRLDTNEIVSVIIWSEHLPILFPPVDFVLITKRYKKLFKIIEQSGIVSYGTIIKNFGNYLDNYNAFDCKIIHPVDALKLKDIFNGLKMEFKVNKFCERIGMEKMVNTLPV